MSAKPDFVHLHLHTEYSLLDGAIRVKDLFKKVTELGAGEILLTSIDADGMKKGCDLELKKAIDFTRRRTDVSFINTGNFKIVANTVRYRLFDAKRFGKIQACDLSAPLFTGAVPDKLFCYREDLEKAERATEANMARLNGNLNALADQSLPRVTEHTLGLGVDQGDLPLLIDDHHGVGRRFQQASEFLFRLPAFGNVARVHDDAGNFGIIQQVLADSF